MYGDGYSAGIMHGDDMTNSEIAHQINATCELIRDLIEDEGFDADAADRAVQHAGYIAGISQRINL